MFRRSNVRSFKSRRRSKSRAKRVSSSSKFYKLAKSESKTTPVYPPLFFAAPTIHRMFQNCYVAKAIVASPTAIINGSQGNTSTISSSSSVKTETNFYFQLDSLPNHSAYQNLFDQYRILRADVTFIPRINVSNGASDSAPTNMTTIVYGIDLDNAAALSNNPDNLRNYASSKEVSCHKTFTVSVAPCRKFAGGDIFGSDQTTSGVTREWVDCGISTVPWYGLRTILSGTTLNNADVVLDVRVTYYVQFRQQI